jgi:hypothetical protein
MYFTKISPSWIPDHIPTQGLSNKHYKYYPPEPEVPLLVQIRWTRSDAAICTPKGAGLAHGNRAVWHGTKHPRLLHALHAGRRGLTSRVTTAHLGHKGVTLYSRSQ